MPKNTEVNPGAIASSATHVYAGTLGKGLLVYRNVPINRWHAVTQGLPSVERHSRACVEWARVRRHRQWIGPPSMKFALLGLLAPALLLAEAGVHRS